MNSEITNEWRARLEYVEEKSSEKNNLILRELELVRAGLTGDTMGWTAKSDGVYVNSITGEERDSEPEVLYLANLIQRAEKVDSLTKEIQVLRDRTDTAVLAKNEAEISLLKLKTELNSFKALHRQWIEASRAVSGRLVEAERVIALHTERVHDADLRLGAMEALVLKLDSELHRVTAKVKSLQVVINEQQNTIFLSNSKIREMEDDLHNKQVIIDKLTKAFNEELALMLRPIQEKLAETSATVLRQNARRVHELRDIAALWPSSHLMPTLLVSHRQRSEEERMLAEELAMERQASLALSIEIRSKMKEKSRWKTEYDDYGKIYFTNSETGEVAYEKPAIMSYVPPHGRDELGAVIVPPEIDWTKRFRMIAVDNNNVLYENLETKEIVENLPTDYARVPRSRSLEEIVKESAQIVLSYIKSIMLQKNCTELQNSPEKRDNLNDEDIRDDILYDIETVEMLADFPHEDSLNDPSQTRWKPEIRSFTRSKSTEIQRQIPRPFEIDSSIVSISELRGILLNLSVQEEGLESTLAQIREDLKDFSQILVSRASPSFPVPLNSFDDNSDQPSIDSVNKAIPPGKTFKEIDDIYDLEPFSAGLGVYIFGESSDTIDLRVHDEEALAMSETASNLVNLALFFGHQGVSINEAYSYKFWSQVSLSNDQCTDNDDEWLSANYFITTSKERIDGVYESIRGINQEIYRSEVSH